jgi:hypothetical protein
MKYKVGDKVRIKNLNWYNENKDRFGQIDTGYAIFSPEMAEHCGRIVTISFVYKNYYDIKEDSEHWYWTDEMIESKIDETIETKVDENNYYKRYIGKHVVAGGNLNGTKGYVIDAKIEDEEFFGETLYLYIKNEFDGTIDKYCKDDVREIIYVEGYRDLD